MVRLLLPLVLLTTSSSSSIFCSAFSSTPHQPPPSPINNSDEQDDTVRQWDLFQKHHAIGSWHGKWNTYDYIGDVTSSTVATVHLESSLGDNLVQQKHEVPMSAVSSDCETCFDNVETKMIPVASYSQGDMKKLRCASVGMVCGPSLLRGGVMATELMLTSPSKKERRRVMFQHGPVWGKGVEPGSCPPEGLKLFRTLVCTEKLIDDEGKVSNAVGNPVIPYMWHAKWSGTSWTWGPTSSDRGWAIDEMEEVDCWHGRPTGDGPDVWCLRLGGMLLQCPRVVVSGEVGICRLAWVMPDGDISDENDVTGRLMRVEAGIKALDPMEMDNGDLVGFHPPSLASLRCDVLMKVGELENASILGKKEEDQDEDTGLDAIRDSLKL